jgi:hypothetical protein
VKIERQACVFHGAIGRIKQKNTKKGLQTDEIKAKSEKVREHRPWEAAGDRDGRVGSRLRRRVARVWRDSRADLREIILLKITIKEALTAPFKYDFQSSQPFLIINFF